MEQPAVAHERSSRRLAQGPGAWRLLAFGLAVLLILCGLGVPAEEYDGMHRRLVADSVWKGTGLGSRGASAVFVLPLLALAAWRRASAQAAALAIGLAIGAAGSCAWNAHRYGDWLAYSYRRHGFDANTLHGAFLFSPGLGIFTFYPLSILGGSPTGSPAPPSRRFRCSQVWPSSARWSGLGLAGPEARRTTDSR